MDTWLSDYFIPESKPLIEDTPVLTSETTFKRPFSDSSEIPASGIPLKRPCSDSSEISASRIPLKRPHSDSSEIPLERPCSDSSEISASGKRPSKRPCSDSYASESKPTTSRRGQSEFECLSFTPTSKATPSSKKNKLPQPSSSNHKEELTNFDEGHKIKNRDWTLFKCTTCQIYFTMECDIIQHISFSHKIQNHERCKICDRSIADSGVTDHKVLHMLEATFNVIDFDDDIPPKLIYKCVDCEVCFDKKSLGSFHTSKQCNIRDDECGKCRECDLVMDKSCLQFHELFHQQFDLRSTYFIIVNVAREMVVPKRRMRLNQCLKCSICSLMRRGTRKHKCLEKKYECYKCQQYFSDRNHEQMHKKIDFTEKDVGINCFIPSVQDEL